MLRCAQHDSPLFHQPASVLPFGDFDANLAAVPAMVGESASLAAASKLRLPLCAQ